MKVKALFTFVFFPSLLTLSDASGVIRPRTEENEVATRASTSLTERQSGHISTGYESSQLTGPPLMNTTNTTSLRPSRDGLNGTFGRDPWFSMAYSLDRRAPIPSEIVYKSLIHSFDWTTHIWLHKLEQYDGLFQSPSPYGVQIVAQRPPPKKQMTRDCVAWFLETIGFWMREDDLFAEMDATIYDGETIYAKLTVRYTGPQSLTNSSTLDQESSNTTAGLNSNGLSHPQAASQRSDNTTLDASSSAIETSNETQKSLQKGSSPHSFDASVRTVITPRTSLGSSPAIEFDIMTALLCIGRQAILRSREPRYACTTPPDRTIVTTNPPEGRTHLFAREVLEGVLDVTEYLYRRKSATGNWYDVEAVVEKKSGNKWRDAVEMYVYAKK